MSNYSPCCRPNAAIARIERAFERVGKFGGYDGVVIQALSGDRGYIVSSHGKRVVFATETAAVRAAKSW